MDGSRYEEAMNELTKQALALIKVHETLFHEGEACMDERVNFVAMVIHRFRLGPAEWDDLTARVMDYEKNHIETHIHKKKEQGH